MSHPDLDHYNLIAKLFEYGELSEQTGDVTLSGGIKFTGRVVLTEAFNWKGSKKCISFLQSLKQLNFKPVLIKGKELRGDHNLIKMATCFTLYFPLSNDGCSGTVYGRGISDKDEQRAIEEGCAEKDFNYNKSSTILKVGKSAVLTGDAHAEALLEDSVLPDGKSALKVFSVPHHGSKHQYTEPCSKKWKCLLVYHALLKFQKTGQSVDLIGHLSHSMRMDVKTMYEEAYFSLLWQTLDRIVANSDNRRNDLAELNKASTWFGFVNRNNSDSLGNPPEHLVKSYTTMKSHLKKRITNHSEAKTEIEISGLFSCLESTGILEVEEIADFYRHIPAETYVISCGSRHKHPHEEVLSGIILSVLRKQGNPNEKTQCPPVTLLVVSGSDSLKGKIIHLPPDIDIEKSAHLVEIKYLKRCNISSIPIDLLSDENSLLSDNDLETWQWWNTPDEQIDLSYTRETFRGEHEASCYSANFDRFTYEDEDPPLSEYLKVVDPSLNPKDMDLSSVLKLLVGPQVEGKLSEYSSSLSKHSTTVLLNKALKLKVKEESEFVLSGESHRQSAKSANLVLKLPESSLSFMDVKVQTINVEVENAKSLDMSIKFDVELTPEMKVTRKMLLDFSEICSDVSSIGRPLSILLSEIGSSSKADEYTVGALLGLILGGARARRLICSFPIKLSAFLALWKLNLNSTVIDFDVCENSLVFRGAFIVGIPPKKPQPIKLTSTLVLEPTTLEIKLPPLLPHSTDGVQISGHCIVNDNDQAEYRALSKSYTSSEVEIQFCDKVTLTDLFITADSDYQIQVLHKKLDQCSVVSTGFIVEQPSEYYPHTKISSCFFQLNPECIESDIQHILPVYLKKRLLQDYLQKCLQHLLPHDLHKCLRLKDVKAVSFFPPDSSQLGLESVFECVSLSIELKLQIFPINEKDTVQHTTSGLMCHSYLLWLRPLPKLEKKDSSVAVVASPSVLDVVKMFCPECEFKDVMLTFPKLNDILDSIQVKYFHTHVNPSLEPLSIQQFELKLYVPNMEIIPHKLAIESADLDFFYSKEHISVSSECRIKIFNEYVCMVSFSLPTCDREGHFSIRNYNNELTLKRALEGFGIPKSFTELPLLSTLLEITIKTISLTLDSDYSITKAELTIYKEEIQMGQITMSEVELTAIYSYSKERSTSESSTFSVQGFIGGYLFTSLSYKASNSELSGSIVVNRKRGKTLRLSSFLDIVGLPKPDIPENVKELFNFMDMELQLASISLKMIPSVTIERLELKLKSGGSLDLSVDPKIILQEVKLYVLYKEADGVTFSVEGHISLSNIEIKLKGQVDPEGLSLKGSVVQPFDFVSAIDELTSSKSTHQSLIPDLPDVCQKLNRMHSLDISVRLEKNKTTFTIECFSSLEFSLTLGTFTLVVQKLGAKVSIITQEKLPVQYSGYICGCFSAYNLQAEVRVALVSEKEETDIVFIGCCQSRDSMHLESLTEAIEGVSSSASQSETRVSNFNLGCVLPPEISDVQIENAVLAANITQKHLIFYLKIREIGSGLLMFCSQPNHNKGCLLGISLPHGYNLRQISNILAPIDDIIKVRELHLLINTMESANLERILDSFHKAVSDSNTLNSCINAFSDAGDCIKEIKDFQLAPPFASFSSTDTLYVRDKELKKGFYLYCKLDIPALKESKGLFSDVIQLSESDFPDIVLSMYIGQGGFQERTKELSLSAYIPSITLFGEIQFSHVHLEYKSSQYSEVTLSGMLSIHLGQDSRIAIMGCMHVSKQVVKFSAEYPQSIDSVSSPLGVAGITLENIKCEVEVRKQKQNVVYIIELQGTVKFLKPQLSFESSIVFKDGRAVMLTMSLNGSLRLSDFLKAAFNFECISRDSFLDIGLHDGQLVYAREPVQYKEYNTKVGFNAMCKITVMKREFKIQAWFIKTSDLQFGIEGSMVGGAIDILGLIQLKSPDFSNDSVVLGCSYSSESGFKLYLSAVVCLLNYDVATTQVSYRPSDGVFEGEVTFEFKFLSEMSIGFQWCKDDGFKIVKWPAEGDLPIQKVLDVIEAIYDIVSLIMAAATGGFSAIITCVAKYIIKKCLKFGFEMNAELEKNPDPNKYRVIIALKLSFVVTFKFLFIKKKLFKADLMKLRVKISKSDGLAKLPERIWDAFVEWIKEKFSDIFSTGCDDSLSFDCVTLPLDILSLDEFDKNFKEFSRVIEAISVISLNIAAIDTMDKQQQRKKEDDKKKLQKLLKKYQNWLEEQKKFIDIACTLRGPPNVILCSPQKLRATWSPPLRGGSERYSYDIKVKAVDSAGITHELIINRSQCDNSIEFDHARIATATMIHVAVRSTLSIPISMLCGEKTASSDETHTLVGEWSEATLMNSTSKPTVMPENRELKPPERITIVYDKCRKSITGDIFLTKAADFSVIIVQLLDCENVISTQPTLLSPLKTKGPEKMITYAFNANNVSHSDASGPYSVQAQVWVWDNSGEDYIKSDFTRSENHIARAQQPEWNSLQYKISEDVVEARIKSCESQSQCSVNFMEGTSIKEESKVFSVPVTSHEDGNGNWCFTADGAYFRNCLNPGSDKLTGLALVEGTMNRLESRPVFSWPKESPVFLLQPPSSLKCEYFPAKSITSTSRGCIQLKWNSHEEDCSFQVGLTEAETSQLLYSECAEMNSQGITIDVYSLSTTLVLPPFKCFVQSLGDIKHINNEQVMSDTVFYPLSKPSILIAEFDYSTSTLTVAFKGDKRASHFLLLCTFTYHPSILITKTKIVEQNYNSTEDLQECSMCFEEGTILGCVSIDVLVQAVGGGSYISSCCQTCK